MHRHTELPERLIEWAAYAQEHGADAQLALRVRQLAKEVAQWNYSIRKRPIASGRPEPRPGDGLRDLAHRIDYVCKKHSEHSRAGSVVAQLCDHLTALAQLSDLTAGSQPVQLATDQPETNKTP